MNNRAKCVEVRDRILNHDVVQHDMTPEARSALVAAVRELTNQLRHAELVAKLEELHTRLET